jgi:hypothetical protein
MRSPRTRFISSVGYWLTAGQARVGARQESESETASAAPSNVGRAGSLPGRNKGQGSMDRQAGRQAAGKIGSGWAEKPGAEAENI